MRVAFVTNLLPNYRRDFYARISCEVDWHLYCCEELKGINLPRCHTEFKDRVTLVPHWALSQEKLGFQRLPYREIAAHDVVVLYGNPRWLSSILLSFYLRLRGTPTILWGQAHSASSRSFSESLRLLWWRLFRFLFVYTDCEADSLRAQGFSKQKIVGANNGLDQEKIEQAIANSSAQPPASATALRLLTCARLSPKNQLSLGLQALAQLKEKDFPLPSWTIIGDGPERAHLESQAQALGLTESVHFLGALYEEDALAPHFQSAHLFLFPGAIGLSLLHAFGYGLPVLTHDDRPAHFPEICAFEEGVTGWCFKKDSVASLADRLCELAQHQLLHGEPAPAFASLQKEAQRRAREEFNTSIMARRFLSLLAAAAPKPAEADSSRPCQNDAPRPVESDSPGPCDKNALKPDENGSLGSCQKDAPAP